MLFVELNDFDWMRSLFPSWVLKSMPPPSRIIRSYISHHGPNTYSGSSWAPESPAPKQIKEHMSESTKYAVMEWKPANEKTTAGYVDSGEFSLIDDARHWRDIKVKSLTEEEENQGRHFTIETRTYLDGKIIRTWRAQNMPSWT